MTWEPAGLLGSAEGAPASMAAHSRRLGPAGPNGRRSGGEKSVCVCVRDSSASVNQKPSLKQPNPNPGADQMRAEGGKNSLQEPSRNAKRR